MATQVTLNSGSVDSAGSLSLKTNGTTTAVTINASQGVEFNAGTAAAPSITTTGDLNTGIFFPAADTIAFSEGGAEAMRINSSGNLLVGTTSGGNNARLKSKVTANTYGLEVTDEAQSDFIVAPLSGGVCRVGPSAGAMAFYASNTECARIDSSGNLFVGTTSNFSADKMCLNFTSAQNGFAVRDDSNSSGANYAVFRNSANGVIGSITRVTTTNAVTYTTTSDQRLKSNIADASPVLDKLMAVKVRQFDWTEGNLHQDYGFIAQELEPTLTGIVTKGETEEDVWQLDYSRIAPHLVKAIQEQQALITALTARITALESK